MASGWHVPLVRNVGHGGGWPEWRFNFAGKSNLLQKVASIRNKRIKTKAKPLPSCCCQEICWAGREKKGVSVAVWSSKLKTRVEPLNPSLSWNKQECKTGESADSLLCHFPPKMAHEWGSLAFAWILGLGWIATWGRTKSETVLGTESE